MGSDKQPKQARIRSLRSQQQSSSPTAKVMPNKKYILNIQRYFVIQQRNNEKKYMNDLSRLNSVFGLRKSFYHENLCVCQIFFFLLFVLIFFVFSFSLFMRVCRYDLCVAGIVKTIENKRGFMGRIESYIRLTIYTFRAKIVRVYTFSARAKKKSFWPMSWIDVLDAFVS